MCVCTCVCMSGRVVTWRCHHTVQRSGSILREKEESWMTIDLLCSWITFETDIV